MSKPEGYSEDNLRAVLRALMTMSVYSSFDVQGLVELFIADNARLVHYSALSINHGYYLDSLYGYENHKYALFDAALKAWKDAK